MRRWSDSDRYFALGFVLFFVGVFITMVLLNRVGYRGLVVMYVVFTLAAVLSFFERAGDVLR